MALAMLFNLFRVNRISFDIFEDPIGACFKFALPFDDFGRDNYKQLCQLAGSLTPKESQIQVCCSNGIPELLSLDTSRMRPLIRQRFH